MELTHVALAEGNCAVRIDGPLSKHTVLLLPGAGDSAAVYDGVCERLHNSDLRTIVPEDITGLDDRSIMALLDELKVGWVNLAGSREGAGLAWSLAARQFGRFASLVVADRGHPAAPDSEGVVRGSDCPPVELPTTVMVGSPDRRAEADASGRFVYSDFRVVQLDGVANIPASAPAELATEIVLRTSPW
ncbi:alpha/beta fold hydrolase [Rhodococcus marinonascens]|uniref:alpha/beta fold hydrolase n=1 Tax=Rhodococcus marinonascens TaxID=38311 RepID=UPI000933A650|nr:alpha/beta hydrolase [Rhodococcus marinonascens]